MALKGCESHECPVTGRVRADFAEAAHDRRFHAVVTVGAISTGAMKIGLANSAMLHDL